ncbi:MAG: beta-ketoacyl-[acyl-carrier-protein] synthase family protein [Candidatus Riflebacteria bacterium]|nr:beta-ketoacyl-[acyl-carrier-protein] synthase family protein [Candidatus Riflebacteria bacterium]
MTHKEINEGNYPNVGRDTLEGANIGRMSNRGRFSDNTRQIVAVTGIGAVTPVGATSAASFEAMCRGENGIRDIPKWKDAGFPITVGGAINNNDLFDREREIADAFQSRKAVFAVAALDEALKMARGKTPTRKDSDMNENANATPDSRAEACREGRGGIFMGVETGRIDIQKLFDMFRISGTRKGLDLKAFGEKSFQYLTPFEAVSKQPYFIPSLLARRFGLRGEIRAISNACSSANQAIGEGFRKVASGALDWAIVGGADDMLDEYMAIGFHLLGALSTGLPADASSRPFDAGHRGFVLGEGAGMLVIEPLERALERGAEPLALIAGYGSGASAGKITETSWEGIHQTMSAAVSEAGVALEDIDYINAHGTGTPMNDPAETLAIKHLFGDHAANIPVSSTKSMIGHLIAAAGAVEAVVCIESIRHGMIHPTRNLVRKDAACDLDYVAEGARRKILRNVLSNSLGFAGINSTVLFQRP